MLMGTVDDTEPGPNFYAGLLKSPFADELTLDFARAALEGEQLGRGDAPDILSISLSGHDYVNHAYSAESRLSHDHLLHLDRMLQAFFQHLDARVGRDSYVLVLTADHGFMPAPEVTAQQGLESGRMGSSRLLSAVNAGLKARFGANNLAPFFSGSSLLLDSEHMAQRKLDPRAVAVAARDLLMAEPGIGAAYTREELSTHQFAGQPLFDAMRRAWSAQVSGDVQYALKPHWMFGSSTSVTTHGSPHAYDTHVPLLMYGPQWIRPGRKEARAFVVDIAPTVARLLHIPAPATVQGQVLTEVLR
jgi:arylsulfatase A-like enzyme